MIEEEYISFETAKLAKEKGFDIPTRYGFSERRSLVRVDTSDNWNQDKELYSRPTQSLLARWLRDNYGQNIYPVMSNNGKYIVWVQDIHSLVKVKTTDLYDTYEEAMEAGLQEALNLLP